MINIKKIIMFLLALLPWFLSSIIPYDNSFYQNLNLPFFAPPSYLFGIVWTIIYILIAISIYLVISNNNLKDIPIDYKKALFFNYLFNQSFSLLFFGIKSPFLGLVATIGTFITSLWLYIETNKIEPRATKFLTPYVLWSLFASILALSVYLLNV